MTTMIEVDTICGDCGKKSEQMELTSTSAYGSSDLDTRPPEVRRSTIHTWVERCPHCGYCSSDISNASEPIRSIIHSPIYRSQLDDPEFPGLANSFLCKALIETRVGKLANAAWSTVNAAWVCDDAGRETSARICRQKAVHLMRKSWLQNKKIAKQKGADIAIAVDLLRRSGQFKEALDLINSNKNKKKEPIIENVLVFEEELILRSDDMVHTVTEAEEKQSP